MQRSSRCEVNFAVDEGPVKVEHRLVAVPERHGEVVEDAEEGFADRFRVVVFQKGPTLFAVKRFDVRREGMLPVKKFSVSTDRIPQRVITRKFLSYISTKF